MTGKDGVSINPSDFSKIPLCELTFEEALGQGAKLAKDIPSKDWRETSIRFHIDGLYKWLDDFAGDHDVGTVFYVIRDAVWMWLSFCDTNPVFREALKAYQSLSSDIAKNTDYTDLVDRMDVHNRLKNVGKSGRPVNILIPHRVAGRLGRYANAVGLNFSTFYQLGCGWGLSRNADGLYSKWVGSKIDPLLKEVMERAELRVKTFAEIRVILQHRSDTITHATTLHM